MESELGDRLPSAFKRLAASSFFAQFSEQIALSAAPLVAVIFLGANGHQTSFLQTLQTLPFLLLSLPAGLMVDRLSRRKLMIFSECMRTISLLLILALLQRHSLSLLMLACCGFMGAIGTVVYSVAAPAMLPTIVSSRNLLDANRWLEVLRSIAFTAGPAIGGALFGLLGASVAYGVATAMSIATVVTLANLTEAKRDIGQRRHIFTELRTGATFVLRHPLLRPILTTAIFFNTAWFILQAVFVVYAIKYLHFTSTTVGNTFAVYGIGMVVGAALAKRLSHKIPLGILIASGPFTALISSIGLLVTIFLPSKLIVMCSFFLFGVGPMLWTITTSSLRQIVTPTSMLGCVSAMIMTVTAGARPIGALIAGALAARYNVEICLVASTMGFTAQLAILVLSPIWRMKQLPAGIVDDCPSIFLKRI